jgi:hypothetical protein
MVDDWTRKTGPEGAVADVTHYGNPHLIDTSTMRNRVDLIKETLYADH